MNKYYYINIIIDSDILVSVSLTCLSLCLSVYHSPVSLPVCLQTPLYVVDPLPWCPHLDTVKPLPPSGIDVFLPCQDCGSDAENWTCLTCYQVTCLTCAS